MEERELRIGNYYQAGIEFKGSVEAKINLLKERVFQLTKENLALILNLDLECFVKPIPLTEEWHNRFGVKINGFMSFEYELPRVNNIKIRIVFTGDYVMLRQGETTLTPHKDDIVSIWNTDLTKRDMYVHEFQDLYSVLTNEYLAIEKANEIYNERSV